VLTIIVNGHEKKINIGCRTFVSLDVLIGLLEADDQEITLNGEAFRNHEFGKTMVNGGDSLTLAFATS
jgi:hypothetical protein